MKTIQSQEVKDFRTIASRILIFLLAFICLLLLVSKYGNEGTYYITMQVAGLILLLITSAFVIYSRVLINILEKRKFPKLGYKRIKAFNKLLYYFVIGLTQLFGIDKKYIRRFFIEINNSIVDSQNEKYFAKDILVIIPHCLQNSSCDIKITEKIEACKQCGKCDITDFVALKSKHFVNICVANGGTSARKKIADNAPKFVIAIACERDLIEGIIDTGSLPVFGVLNSIPNGPCKDTKVDTNKIEAVLKKVII